MGGDFSDATGAGTSSGDDVATDATPTPTPHGHVPSCTLGAGEKWIPVGSGSLAPRDQPATWWTGSKYFVFGGLDWGGGSHYSDGGLYDPSADSWTALPTTNAPSGRWDAEYEQVDGKLVVWGGNGGGQTGSIYDPLANTWTPIQSTGAPSTRAYFALYGFGRKFLVWGGWAGTAMNTGGIYDLDSSTWTAMSTVGAPSARAYFGHAFDGRYLYVYGGTDDPAPWQNPNTDVLGAGGIYDTQNDTWSSFPASGAPSARRDVMVEWLGTKLAVWGGMQADRTPFDDGALYDPVARSWSPIATANAPTARGAAFTQWTGKYWIVWSGADSTNSLNTGAIYDPATNEWVWSMTTLDAPEGRGYLLNHANTWNGTEFFVWGGWNASGGLNTGGRYVLPCLER